ncbi:hypothetical protein N7456_004843 [Penicillium angulare]|uniref:NAD(P)-binding protein n=1 Tax=Penicillium angulare TaxID=116970 RepID=A0A9W9FXF7_9EURO|nr:hypothetical protein N7456_004843 [Penicillium angulare]
MPESITLVIGASRGIGQEIVHQLSKDPNNQIIASVRTPTEFNNPRVKSVVLDLGDRKSVEAAATQVPEIDTLIINAAIGDGEKVLTTSDERLAEYFHINVGGPLRVVQAFLPALLARQTRKIVLISSSSGSLVEQINASSGFSGPYSLSKGAGNMLVIQLHNELRHEGFTLLAVHPGWVATDMGNISGSGGMPIPKSAQGVLQQVERVEKKDSPLFVAWDGSVIQW